MSESYERERQNNARLEELSAKVSALRGVTVDIYDNARAQDVIDSTVSRILPSSSLLPLLESCS
jgi:blocked early in transport 1